MPCPVTIYVECPGSKKHPRKVWGKRITAVVGTRDGRDIHGDWLPPEMGILGYLEEGNLILVVAQQKGWPTRDLRVLAQVKASAWIEEECGPADHVKITIAGAELLAVSRQGEGWAPIFEGLNCRPTLKIPALAPVVDDCTNHDTGEILRGPCPECGRHDRHEVTCAMWA